MMVSSAVTAFAPVQKSKKVSRETQHLQLGPTAASAGRRKVSLVNLYCHRPHNQIERKDDARSVLSAQDDTLQPLQGPSLDSGTPSGLQVRMRFCAQLRRQACAKRFDLFVWQSCRLAVETDKPRDAGNLQNFQTLAQRQAHKHVTRKQRQLQLHPPVLPAPHTVIKRKKILDASFLELLSHTLFVVRAGVRDIPVRLFKCYRQVRRLSIVSFRNA